MNAFLAGLLLGFSLILVIGAQNAFVLRQGILGRFVFAVCLLAAISDAVLISIGTFGVGGYLGGQNDYLALGLKAAGIVFLGWYGAMKLRNAWRMPAQHLPKVRAGERFLPTMATCLAITWLNPHVYLDTVVVIGGVSSSFPQAKAAFAAGATLASFVFFFLLGYGGRLVGPVFERPGAWKRLDMGVGVMMLAIAAGLLLKNV
jgi:L-lysine exporter family protein LysE/ArgO